MRGVFHLGMSEFSLSMLNMRDANSSCGFLLRFMRPIARLNQDLFGASPEPFCVASVELFPEEDVDGFRGAPEKKSCVVSDDSNVRTFPKGLPSVVDLFKQFLNDDVLWKEKRAFRFAVHHIFPADVLILWSLHSNVFDRNAMPS